MVEGFLHISFLVLLGLALDLCSFGLFLVFPISLFTVLYV